MVSSVAVNGESAKSRMNGGTSGHLVLYDEPHAGLILSSLNMMRKNKHFCDVILHVGSTEVHGHRAILAAASPYLFELFGDDNQGVGKEPVSSYKLSESLDKHSLRKLVDYAYTAKLEALPGEVKNIYVAACQLKMERVASQCANYLLDSLTPESCLDIRALPGITQNELFIKQLEHYIRQNFEAVCGSPALSYLPSVKIEVLYQTSQEMSLVNATSLCCLVLDWIKRYIDDAPGSGVDHLLEKTHLLYLAMDNSLQDCSDLPSGDVGDTDIVQDYKKLSLKCQTQSKNRRKGTLQPAKPRVLIYPINPVDDLQKQLEADWNLIGVNKVGEHTFLAIVTLDGRLAKLSVALRLNTPSSPGAGHEGSGLGPFEESRSTSSEPELFCALPTMKAGKCAVGCGNLHGTLLVCGGYDRVECLRSVDQYVPETNTWEKLSDMREARGRFGVAILDGKVYAVGGSNGTNELATVEMLDLSNNNKWTKVASLPQARSNAGICSLGGKIYCIGGWDGQTGMRQCETLDPETGLWTSVAPLNAGRYQAGVCSFKNQIYAAGGCDSWNCLNSVEIYDPSADAWTIGPALITARRGCGLAEFQGRLYAVGGSTGTHSLASTEVLDPIEQVWLPGPNMSNPRANVAVAVVGNRLYAVGGFTGKNFLNSIEYLDPETHEWTSFVPRTDGICTPPLPEYVGYSDSSANGSEKDAPHRTTDAGSDIDNSSDKS